MVTVGQPNPFDFSDFGPPKRPTGPTPPHAAPGGPAAAFPQASGGFSTGFDPWANQPKTQPRLGQSGGQDAFGQPTSAAMLATAGPPLKWFGVTLLLAVAGVVLAVVSAASGGGVLVPALVGWLLAGPLAIGACVEFQLRSDEGSDALDLFKADCEHKEGVYTVTARVPATYDCRSVYVAAPPDHAFALCLNPY